MIVLDTGAKTQNTHHSMMKRKIITEREMIFVTIKQTLFARPAILRR